MPGVGASTSTPTNTNWSLPPSKPLNLDITQAVKDAAFAKGESQATTITSLGEPKDKNETRPTACSAGFDPSGVQFNQPARAISAGEAGKMITTACKKEIQAAGESVKQAAEDKLGKTGALVVGGAAAIAVTGKVAGSTDVLGAKVSAGVDIKKRSLDLSVSRNFGGVDVSANVQQGSGSRASGSVRAATNLGGFDVSASVSTPSDGNNKPSTGVFISRSFKF